MDERQEPGERQPAESGGAEFADGLRRIRRRRWFLWILILVYVPVIWLTLEVTGSDRETAVVFFIWVVLVGIAATWTASCRCPRCGNLFHVHGVTPLYLRRCLHCGLHIRADKTS